MKTFMTVRCLDCGREDELDEATIYRNKVSICKDCYALQVAVNVKITDATGLDRILLSQRLRRLLCDLVGV